MKKISIVAIILLFLVAIPQKSVQAADNNACRVTISRKELRGIRQKATICGKNKLGKVIWKYNTSVRMLTELDEFEVFVNGKYAYIFDYTTLIKVRIRDGKKIWKTKKIIPAQRTVCFDSKGNIYMSGFYDNRVYKVSSKGKIVWKTNFKKTSLFWPYKMKYNKGTIKVYCDASLKDESIHHFLYINASNGKIKKYI